MNEPGQQKPNWNSFDNLNMNKINCHYFNNRQLFLSIKIKKCEANPIDYTRNFCSLRYYGPCVSSQLFEGYNEVHTKPTTQ